MGVFGAINTAVSGLRAQAFALENISGNIANSQTTGFKRQDTSFAELVADSGSTQATQNAGAVSVSSRATNEIQGSIVAAEQETFIAIQGDGYFAVRESSGLSNGQPIFTGPELYTRAGDFQISNSGFLQNGAGLFLSGFPTNITTGAVDTLVAQPIQIPTDPLPPQATSVINFRANLPINPETEASVDGNAASGLLDPSLRVPGAPVAVPAVPGTLSTSGFAAANVTNGDAITVTVNDGTGPTTLNITFGAGGGANELDATTPFTEASLAAAIQSLADTTFGAGTTTFAAGTGTELNLSATGGNISFAFVDNDGANDVLTQTSTNFAAATTATPATAVGVATISNADQALFVNSSIAGGTTTVLDARGEAVNVEFRFAKTDSSDSSIGGIDTYNLYYRANSDGVTEPAFVRVDQQYTFGPNGQLDPLTTPVTISNFTVDGLSIGQLTLDSSPDGFTQVATPTPTGQVSNTSISANGSPLGLFNGVTITDAGNIAISYTNGANVEVARISVVTFDNDAGLERVNGGGTFAATVSSGAPITDSSSGGSIIGSALESSNTDIADEFTKLIVTQQAYTANARIITTGDEILTEAINLIR